MMFPSYETWPAQSEVPHRTKQLFLIICPLSGQEQASRGAMWQVEVTVFPLLSIAVQLVQ